MDTNNHTFAASIAEYIISRFYKKDEEVDEDVSEGISNLKLQQLLCFCQAFALVRLDQPMFKEKVYAWKYGPVVKEVYEKYKQYKNKPIPMETISQGDNLYVSDDYKEVIDEVLDIFGEYSAVRLMKITHSHKPWKDLEEQVVAGQRDIEITHETMKEYYRPLLVSDDGND